MFVHLNLLLLHQIQLTGHSIDRPNELIVREHIIGIGIGQLGIELHLLLSQLPKLLLELSILALHRRQAAAVLQYFPLQQAELSDVFRQFLFPSGHEVSPRDRKPQCIDRRFGIGQGLPICGNGQEHQDQQRTGQRLHRIGP